MRLFCSGRLTEADLYIAGSVGMSGKTVSKDRIRLHCHVPAEGGPWQEYQTMLTT